MKRQQLAVLLMAAAFIAAPFGALACGAAAANIHVGPVLSVNEVAGTFTIRDAETQRPITFRSDATTIRQVQAAQGRVTVHYENDGDLLRATDVSR